MKVTKATKKNHAFCQLRYLDKGEVFCTKADYERYPESAVECYIVAERNGHRIYINLHNGTEKPFNTDTAVYYIDAELMVYGIKG